MSEAVNTFTPKLFQEWRHAAQQMLIAHEEWSSLTKQAEDAFSSTLARRWYFAKPFRKAITDALRIDRSDPTAEYATWPFRVVEEDGANWIAAGVAHDGILSDTMGLWDWLDAQIILWNPRTGETRCDEVIAPEGCEEVTVYTDPFAFFRAWCDKRAETYARHLDRPKWQRTSPDPEHHGLPGAFLRDLAKTRSLRLDARIAKAAPCTDPKALNRALIRSANLPRVSG